VVSVVYGEIYVCSGDINQSELGIQL